MYQWDLRKIAYARECFQRNAHLYTPAEKEIFLFNFKIVDSYLREVPNFKVAEAPSDTSLYFKAQAEHQAMRNTNLLLTEGFHKIINQPFIGMNVAEIPADYKFSDDDAVTIVFEFFNQISHEYGHLFKQVIELEKLLLKKSDYSRADTLQLYGKENIFIGIRAYNFQDMMSLMVHEFGHYLLRQKGNSCGFHKETLPILLELYFAEYLKKNFSRIDILPVLQKRFVTDNDSNLLTIKTIYETSLNLDPNFVIPKIKKLPHMTEENDNFVGSFEYYLATKRAVDLYRLTKNKKKVIEYLIKFDSRNLSIYQQMRYTDECESGVFDLENIRLQRRLVS